MMEQEKHLFCVCELCGEGMRMIDAFDHAQQHHKLAEESMKKSSAEITAMMMRTTGHPRSQAGMKESTITMATATISMVENQRSSSVDSNDSGIVVNGYWSEGAAPVSQLAPAAGPFLEPPVGMQSGLMTTAAGNSPVAAATPRKRTAAGGRGRKAAATAVQNGKVKKARPKKTMASGMNSMEVPYGMGMPVPQPCPPNGSMPWSAPGSRPQMPYGFEQETDEMRLAMALKQGMLAAGGFQQRPIPPAYQQHYNVPPGGGHQQHYNVPSSGCHQQRSIPPATASDQRVQQQNQPRYTQTSQVGHHMPQNNARHPYQLPPPSYPSHPNNTTVRTSHQVGGQSGHPYITSGMQSSQPTSAVQTPRETYVSHTSSSMQKPRETYVSYTASPLQKLREINVSHASSTMQKPGETYFTPTTSSAPGILPPIPSRMMPPSYDESRGSNGIKWTTEQERQKLPITQRPQDPPAPVESHKTTDVMKTDMYTESPRALAEAVYDTNLIYTCEFCSQRFDTENSIRGHHKLQHRILKEFSWCEFCGQKFEADSGLLKQHIQSQHVSPKPEDPLWW